MTVLNACKRHRTCAKCLILLNRRGCFVRSGRGGGQVPLLGALATRRFSLDRLRRASSFALSAACASCPAFGSTGGEPLACAFFLGCRRHSSLIRWIAASVVKCLPAMTSISNRPLAASLRKPETVIPPAGKASLTATSNRRGVSGENLLIFQSQLMAERTSLSEHFAVSAYSRRAAAF